jgi:hypothetical protein
MSIHSNMLTLIETATEAVKQSLTSFVENDLESSPEEFGSKLMSEVSAGLNAGMIEAAKQAYKAFVEQYDSKEQSIARNGKTYRLKESAKKKFLTLFGELEISRNCYYSWEGGKGIVPLDEGWEMQDRYAITEVVEKILWLAAKEVPTEIGKTCKKFCPFHPSPSCVQDIISSDGAGVRDMIEFEQRESPGCREEIKIPLLTEVFAVGFDGANVRMGGVCRAAGGGSRTTYYKNAMVGSFSFYGREDGVVDMETGVEGIVAQRIKSIYCARMPEDRAIGFKEELESTLQTIDQQLDKSVQKVLIIDGARPLWTYAENNPLFEDYQMILDFYHASEHLSAAAEALFGRNTDEGKEWHKKWRYKLKYDPGAVSGLLRSMTYYSKTRRMGKSRREALAKEIVFFTRNKERMDYPKHIQNGWPIGSGPTEAACKTIVKARMCQSGMCWTHDGGANVLNLRVLTKSDNHWELAWNRYTEQHWPKKGAA